MNITELPLETLAELALDSNYPQDFRAEVIIELTRRAGDEAYRRGYSAGLEEGKTR